MKIIKAFFSIICCFILSSCAFFNTNNSKKYNPSDVLADDHPFAEETASTLLECLDESDRNTLQKLLSESVLSQADLNEQIECLFDFYEGKTISHDTIRSGTASSEAREGRYEYKSLYIIIDDIATDNNKKYKMEFYYVLVDNDNPSRIGISRIMFYDTDGKSILDLFGENK